MRWKWIALLAIAGLATASAATEPRRVRSVRTVQLIAMPQVASGPAHVEDEGWDGFRTHDLSRRWVEHPMRATLEEGDAGKVAQVDNPDDPFRPQLRAGDAAAIGPVPLSSAIQVPGWMLGGASSLVPSRFAPGCSASPYRPTGFLRFQAETRRQNLYGMISSIACEYGIPVGLFDAMIIRESRYDPAIVSPKNAYGLTQLMPGTAADLGVNRYDVASNLRGGASYLRQQLDRFGQFHLALAAYNAGPGRVRGAVPAIAETRAYVDDIMRNWSRLSGFERRAVVQGLACEALEQRAATGPLATSVTF